MNMELDPLIKMLHQTHGVDLSSYDPAFLLKSLEKRLAATASQDAAAYLQRLQEDRSEADTFFRSLLVTYSEFFRNPLTFALLEQLVLPCLVEAIEKSGRSELRLWSAGCAAGQEAYSVAILLDELARKRGRPIPFRIFATDLSEPDLALARAGVFSAAGIANVCVRHLGEYFLQQGESYTLISRIKDRVDFSLYNLLDTETTCPPASVFGDFDLVLCSNVLLYYRPETQRILLNKIRQSLAAGGYFITGETERQIVANAGSFRASTISSTVFNLNTK